MLSTLTKVLLVITFISTSCKPPKSTEERAGASASSLTQLPPEARAAKAQEIGSKGEGCMEGPYGPMPVSYTVVADGFGGRMADLNGDTRVSLDLIRPSCSKNQGLKLAAARSLSRQWPGCRIPYRFAEIDPTEVKHTSLTAETCTKVTSVDEYRSFIEGEMRKWEKTPSGKATGISFVPASDRDVYAVSLFLNSDQPVSFATLGRESYSHTLMGKGYNCDGTVLHQLGHVIGIIHEQRRPDRDQYIKIEWGDAKDKGKYNFRKASEAEVKIMTPYDVNSIMHYPTWSNGYWQDIDVFDWESETRPTIYTIDGDEIPFNTTISDLDYEGVIALCEQNKNVFVDYTQLKVKDLSLGEEDGLQVLQFTPDSKATVTQYQICLPQTTTCCDQGYRRNKRLWLPSYDDTDPLLSLPNEIPESCLNQSQYEVKLSACVPKEMSIDPYQDGLRAQLGIDSSYTYVCGPESSFTFEPKPVPQDQANRATENVLDNAIPTVRADLVLLAVKDFGLGVHQCLGSDADPGDVYSFVESALHKEGFYRNDKTTTVTSAEIQAALAYTEVVASPSALTAQGERCDAYPEALGWDNSTSSCRLRLGSLNQACEASGGRVLANYSVCGMTEALCHELSGKWQDGRCALNQPGWQAYADLHKGHVMLEDITPSVGCTSLWGTMRDDQCQVPEELKPLYQSLMQSEGKFGWLRALSVEEMLLRAEEDNDQWLGLGKFGNFFKRAPQGTPVGRWKGTDVVGGPKKSAADGYSSRTEGYSSRTEGYSSRTEGYSSRTEGYSSRTKRADQLGGRTDEFAGKGGRNPGSGGSHVAAYAMGLVLGAGFGLAIAMIIVGATNGNSSGSSADYSVDSLKFIFDAPPTNDGLALGTCTDIEVWKTQFMVRLCVTRITLDKFVATWDRKQEPRDAIAAISEQDIFSSCTANL